MYKIVYKNEQEKEIKKSFISPQIPPNNLKTIKELYSYTDKEIANLIDVEAGFVSGVVNNRAIFSGLTTLKLLKELNLSFSTLYGMNKKIKTNCEYFKEGSFIVSIEDSKIENNYLNKIISEIIYDDENTTTNAIYIELDVQDSELTLDLKKVPRLMSESELDYIKSSINEANVENSFTMNNIYFLIYFSSKSFIDREFEINTEKALDVEINNILFSLPFKKFINITLPASDFNVDLNRVILKDNFTIIRNNRLVNTNILYDNEYGFLSDGQSIIFKTFSAENSLNKFKVYRYIKGYDMHYMANALNLSVESYRLLEVGHNRLTTHQMWKLENKLGIQLENIIDINSYIKNFEK